MKEISVNDVLDILNQAANRDPVAIGNLVTYRVECNSKLCDHPTIQVSPERTVGLLGIINGIVRHCGMKPIAAVVNTDGTVRKFIHPHDTVSHQPLPEMATQGKIHSEIPTKGS